MMKKIHRFLILVCFLLVVSGCAISSTITQNESRELEKEITKSITTYRLDRDYYYESR